METGITKDEGQFFILIIRGFAPEFMNGVLFRRTKQTCSRRVKEIKCPYCGRHFEMVGADTQVEVFRQPHKSRADCHSYRNCRACRGEVGIKFA